MKTLIELYDERPLENVLATEMFRPERTVFLCPQEVVQDKVRQRKLREYFQHRGLDSECIFIESSIYNAAKVKRQLQSLLEKYEDCVLDITGGTDAALFGGGLLCADSDLPVFTYSRKKGEFYNIHNADFAENLPCEIQYKVEDCFLMAGGAMRMGRVDNAVLGQYMDVIDPFFALYMKHRRDWTRIISYIQRISQNGKDEPVTLSASGKYTVKGEQGRWVTAHEEALRDLEKLGFIRQLAIVTNESVSFEFKDLQIRSWLRDIGSVLELYIYKACLDTGIFQDVHTSAVVDWEGDFQRDNVTNELDVMAMKGVIPVFISCKTCQVSTEALNELAILRDRFGGDMSRAAIVTAERTRNVTRHRAEELNIKVIDLDDLKSDAVKELLCALMHSDS